MEFDVDIDVVLCVYVGGIGGYVEYCCVYCVLVVDVVILVMEVLVDFVFVDVKVVGYCGEMLVGVVVGVGDVIVELVFVDCVGGLGIGCDMGDLVFVVGGIN